MGGETPLTLVASAGLSLGLLHTHTHTHTPLMTSCRAALRLTSDSQPPYHSRNEPLSPNEVRRIAIIEDRARWRQDLAWRWSEQSHF